MRGIGNGILLRPGMRVGLFGGSFDPSHMGHLNLSLNAKRLFDLDRVIWLVSPGNPLKADAPASMSKRMAAAHELLDGRPFIRPSDFEQRRGIKYTVQTVSELRHLYPKTHFVWLMGGDNLGQMHHWLRWRDIMHALPIGVVARPGQRSSVMTKMMPRAFRFARLSANRAPTLALKPAPAWCFVNVPMRADSSSKIRASGQW